MAGALVPLLTVLDDHSRFLLCLAVCPDEQGPTVQAQLRAVFAVYGRPERILGDNGGPWGTPTAPGESWSHLEVWLAEEGVAVWHGAPYHPQTQGKDERIHRTLKEDLADAMPFADTAALQTACTAYRALYNTTRPHDALDLAVPADRYTPSPRRTAPSAWCYSSEQTVHLVRSNGQRTLGGVTLRLGKAFAGKLVGVSPTGTAALDAIHFGPYLIATVDHRQHEDTG